MYKLLLTLMVSVLFVGCTSVPLASVEDDLLAKEFNKPIGDTGKIYIYRHKLNGITPKRAVYINQECVGETAPNTYFVKELPGNKIYTISTESEFSNNDVEVNVQSGKNHFVEQYIKVGVFTAGTGVRAVTEEDGKKAIAKMNLAIAGTCNS